jgi:hypothetical protein
VNEAATGPLAGFTENGELSTGQARPEGGTENTETELADKFVTASSGPLGSKARADGSEAVGNGEPRTGASAPESETE